MFALTGQQMEAFVTKLIYSTFEYFLYSLFSLLQFIQFIYSSFEYFLCFWVQFFFSVAGVYVPQTLHHKFWFRFQIQTLAMHESSIKLSPVKLIS